MTEHARCRRTRAIFGVPACSRPVDAPKTVSGKTTHTVCGERCALLLMAEREKWTRVEVERMLARLAEGEQRARERRGRGADEPEEPPKLKKRKKSKPKRRRRTAP